MEFKKVDGFAPTNRNPINDGPLLMGADGSFMTFSPERIGEQVPQQSTQDSSESKHSSSTLRKSIDSFFKMQGLFGGAICTAVPASFEDISVIREVPDHQEVYVDRSSDMSLIVELLSLDESVSNERAARNLFEDLTDHNQARDSFVESDEIIQDPTFIPKLNPSFPRSALIGRQKVKKFSRGMADTDTAVNTDSWDDIRIYLVLVRLLPVGTDLLITLNVPINQTLAAQSASGVAPEEIIKAAANHLDILNWSLFV